MDTDGWLGLSLLLVCLSLVGFVAVTQAALSALTRIRRGQNGSGVSWAKGLEWMWERRRSLQVTLLVVNTASIVFLSVIARRLLYPEQRLTWDNVILLGVVLVLLLLLFQAVPYALAARMPTRALRVVKSPLRWVDLALTPVTALCNWFGQLSVRSVRRSKTPSPPREEEEAIEAIVEAIEEEGGALEKEERDMIRRIMHMETTTVRDIMAPRMDIIAAEADASPAEVVDLIVKHGYSRVPIYEETIDNIVGVVYAKDLLKALQSTGAVPSLRSLARKAYFVPESKKTADLLKEFRQERVHMAIIVDEYGGTAGLVALEDLLEEIVGEIEDEYDVGEKAIEPVSEHDAVIDARVSIDDLNELFGTEIAPQDFATVGGLVYAQLGKIPNVGDEVQVDGLTISVISTLGRRIKKVRAVHHQTPDENAVES